VGAYGFGASGTQDPKQSRFVPWQDIVAVFLWKLCLTPLLSVVVLNDRLKQTTASSFGHCTVSRHTAIHNLTTVLIDGKFHAGLPMPGAVDAPALNRLPFLFGHFFLVS